MFGDKEYFILNDNGLILVEGEDRFSFIQGIISNDIEILKKKTIDLFLFIDSSREIQV